jgi:hypothetical protein
MEYFRPVHIDPAHAPFTVSLTTGRIVPDSPPALSPLGVPESGRTLRSHAQNPAPITQQPVALAPSYGGGNFIDHSLKVRIIQAAGTLLGHKQTYKHSTTPLCGTLACGGTIPFTARIKEEFEKMMERGTHIEIHEGEFSPESD